MNRGCKHVSAWSNAKAALFHTHSVGTRGVPILLIDNSIIFFFPRTIRLCYSKTAIWICKDEQTTGFMSWQLSFTTFSIIFSHLLFFQQFNFIHLASCGSGKLEQYPIKSSTKNTYKRWKFSMLRGLVSQIFPKPIKKGSLPKLFICSVQFQLFPPQVGQIRQLICCLRAHRRSAWKCSCRVLVC